MQGYTLWHPRRIMTRDEAHEAVKGSPYPTRVLLSAWEQVSRVQCLEAEKRRLESRLREVDEAIGKGLEWIADLEVGK